MANDQLKKDFDYVKRSCNEQIERCKKNEKIINDLQDTNDLITSNATDILSGLTRIEDKYNK